MNWQAKGGGARLGGIGGAATWSYPSLATKGGGGQPLTGLKQAAKGAPPLSVERRGNFPLVGLGGSRNFAVD